MRWFSLQKRGRHVSGADLLRDALFDAVDRGDEEAIDRMCRDNRDRILANFQTWRTATPPAARADHESVNRYGRCLLAIADWFASSGSPGLRESLLGSGGDNPIHRWEDRFGDADRFKEKGRWVEAITILEEVAREMGGCKGAAVEKYLPMVHGSLGECFFRTMQLDRAHDATRAALDGCLRSGDIEGVIIYAGNLAEICRERGETDHARRWLILTTNAMIQAGQVERAAQVRRHHGLEPAAGLIEVQGMSLP